MRSPRDLATSLLFGALSMIIVLGGVSLSLAEGNAATLQIPPISPSTPAGGAPTAVPAAATDVLATVLPAEAAPATATWTTVPTLPAPTSAASIPSLSPTACHQATGWAVYIIQPGDTLYAIASRYGTTLNELEQANCRTTTILHSGDRLYVPNVATHAPAPTEAPSDTPIPTDTQTVPSDTPQPTATSAPSDTPAS